MKIEGRLEGLLILLIIDSGASHNYIAKELVISLNLPVTDTTKFVVTLGDGSRKDSQGICEGLKIIMGKKVLNINAYVLEIGGIDLILGMEWLETLGEVKSDWRRKIMSFQQGGQTITLKGYQADEQYQAGALQEILHEEEEAKENFHQTLIKLDMHKVEELEGMLQLYQRIFQDPQGLLPKREYDHAITLKAGAEPVSVRPYKYAYHHKDEIERQVKELLQAGTIKHSISPFSSPIILVKKKDGTWRMCADYRALNKVTILDKFPIPTINELLDELHKAKYFSKIDLKSGFHQIRVREEDTHKTAFRTHEGHYEYLVMPFGLMNAPLTFQATMNSVFQPLLRKYVLVFFDDILVFSPDWSQHLQHLEEVFRLLIENNFYVNRKKCLFGQQSVEYLGHVISGEGVAMDPTKVQCVKDWPVPRNVKGVHGFLGLTGYYRQFIKDYGRIARPLTELTKKDGFRWNAQAQQAFEELKSKLSTFSVLALPDFSKEFIVECDASGRGIGAVLMQDHKPIAFFSKALAPCTLSKSVYEKEIMALVLAVQHWRHYLMGRPFKVFTDHKSLRHLLQQRLTTTNQHCWLSKLMGYQFEIVYKPGAENKVADALSRIEENQEMNSIISSPYWLDFTRIKEEIWENLSLKLILEILQKNPTKKPDYTLQGDLLFYKGKVVLSSTSSIIPSLLQEFHSTPVGGHSGFTRTYKRLARSFFWPGMRKTIIQYVKKCDVCQ